MTEAKDVFEIAATGERFVFGKRARDTGGELLEIDFHVREFAPPAHVHLRVEERVEIVSGRALVRLGRKEWSAGPGEKVVFPAGVGHTFRAEGEEMLHFRCEVVPAADMETLFETIFGLYRDGKANSHGQPNIFQNAILAWEHEAVLPGPPVWLQRAVLRLAAWTGRRLGYRARYERYSGPEAD